MMTLECYLVWYRGSNNEHDIVVGTANKWSIAKSMAENLYASKKKMDGIEELSTGVTRVEFGTLYMKQKPKGRWQILPIMSVDTPAW
tara:strand:+ start:2111 stop:2371 length:261 start_codon:yes stop_codon:yes gene_type:complete